MDSDYLKKTYSCITVDVKLDYSGVKAFDEKFYNYLPPKEFNEKTVKLIIDDVINGRDNEIAISVMNNELLSEYILYNDEAEDVLVDVWCKYGLNKDDINALINGETVSLYFEMFYTTLKEIYADKQKMKELKDELQKVMVDYLQCEQPISFRVRFDEGKKENPPEVTGLDIYIAMKCTTEPPNYRNYRQVIYS